MTETQQRFLKAIAERLGERPVMEVRLFPAIRQGPHESGVAVVAVEEEADDAREIAVEQVAPASAGGELEAQAPAPLTGTRQAARLRYSILTARFRLTIKGPERGKWEFDLVHDADAPLDTIEPVVRGVARRVGDAGEPDLLSPDDFQRAVSEPWWNATA